jgi:hypothetical protein
MKLWFWQISWPGVRMMTLVQSISHLVSRRLLGHGFGAYPAPCGSASFCFGYAALRVMVPP